LNKIYKIQGPQTTKMSLICLFAWLNKINKLTYKVA